MTGAKIYNCLPCKIKEIVAHLRLCAYECEGGPLENNISFRELCEIADSHPDYWADLEGLAVIVESDCSHHPVVASFPFDLADGKRPDYWDDFCDAALEVLGDGSEHGCAAGAWAQAEAHIARLRAGDIEPVAVEQEESQHNEN